MSEDLSSYPGLKTAYDRLQRRYDSLCKAIQGLEEQIMAKDGAIEDLRKRVIAAQQNVDIQKMVMQNNLSQSRAEQDGLVADIIELRQLVRDLGGKLPA